MYLILADETLKILPDAVAVGHDGEDVVFRNEDGRIVARYRRPEVMTYGGDIIPVVHRRLHRRRPGISHSMNHNLPASGQFSGQRLEN